MVQQQEGASPSAVFICTQKNCQAKARQSWSRCAVTYSNLTTDMFIAEESAHVHHTSFNHHASYELLNRKNC
ncbi:hypothetical protein EV199_5346 [Pseudobacter ginsenosidimutans]|uniref:Uncharacterized protein n=1 Tax=Pseudobacter ginsenosidimutans TaxID=661488 RepID=A0A4Q7MJM6_9BACT|nr:hypothetical protein EV199_5346 [Pseudobacter ginsenosidimutans]